MSRFVITPDVARRLAAEAAVPADGVALLAPTLLRSQLLADLYGEVGRGELARRDAERYLDHVRALRIRLLGDRVLQRVAWQVAEQLGWPDTLDAEYVALTRLHADALVTLDPRLAAAVEGVVELAPYEAIV